MQPADEFDEFYKSTRTALLQQTFALTGDLPASRGAVRDAFVAAWHHWRKVSRLEDRGGWVRPLAWRHAQRRHSARIFHRDRKLDPDIRATLDALAKLPLSQRKVLLLTQLTDVSMPDIAREVGLTLHDAETATAAGQLPARDAARGADDGHPAAVRAAARARRRHALAARHHHPARRHHPPPGPHRRRGGRRRGRARARRCRGHRRAGRQAVPRERPRQRRGRAAPRPRGRRVRGSGGGRCGRRSRARVRGRRGPRQPRPAHVATSRAGGARPAPAGRRPAS